MASISNNSIVLPSAQSLFAGGQQQAQVQVPSTEPVAGPTVSGVGGSTSLPHAAPADFSSGNPTALDQPHPQYTGLIQSHVAVLQAIGTPEAVITQLNQQRPQAEYLDRYIQGEIMQNPEGWDDYVGNPKGTARAGLQQLLPGVQLPGAGGGTPGYLNDGSTVSGINVPGLTQPIMDPTGQPAASEGEGLIKGFVIAAAAVGVGLLAWKFIKNRKGAADAAKVVTEQARQAVTGGGGAAEGLKSVAGANSGWAQQLSKLTELFGGSADKADDVLKATTLTALATGGHAEAATAYSILKGLGPANGHLNAAGMSAAAFDIPIAKALQSAENFRFLDVMEVAAKNGQLGDLAVATMASKLVGGGGAQAAVGAATSASNPALKAMLQTMLAAL